MFALSFSLMYLLMDYSIDNAPNNSDIVYYITSFQTINDLSWLGIFDRFINTPNQSEPLFWIFVKIFRVLFFGNAVLYLFFHYFITFFLIAYLGKIVHTNKFVIVIVYILLLNGSILIGITAFRQTTAFLLFLIGIFLFDAREKGWSPRILIYSSMFFHISMPLLIFFFEAFSLIAKRGCKFGNSQLYSMKMGGYIAIPILAIILINENFFYYILTPLNLYSHINFYFSELATIVPYAYTLFNWFTFLILLCLWLRRKKLQNSEVFIATLYFIIIAFLNEISLPGVFRRFTYFAQLGGALIVGRLATENYKLGFILLMFIFILWYSQFHFNTPLNKALSERVYSEFMNPVYGLGRMILNYDTLLNFKF